MATQDDNMQDPADRVEELTQAQTEPTQDFEAIGTKGGTDLGNNTTISGGSGSGGYTSGSAAGATGAGADRTGSASDTQAGYGSNPSQTQSGDGEPTGGKWGLSREQDTPDADDTQHRGEQWGLDEHGSGSQRGGQQGDQMLDDDAVDFESDMDDRAGGSSAGGTAF